MLCYRCGSHVPDGSEACGACGQKFSSGNLRQATGTFSRRKMGSQALENAPFKPGEILVDRYVVKDAIGAGPLGFVFKAQDKEIDVEVALKVISPKLVQTPEERRAFAKEIRLARKLTHNNVIRVYEDGEASDRPFYTMQFLDGLTLRRIIDLRKEKNQFFSLREIEPIFAQIANGLEAAHKVIPHTDLKPENVVVLPDLLKITDFGIGSAIPRQPFVAAQKARGTNAHRYLSPEYCSGQEVDRRTDVYSMGVLLGEMVANSFPEAGGSVELRGRNPDLPAALESVWRRSTNENPLARYATVAEFWAELDGIIVKSSPPPEPPPRKASASRPPPPRDPGFEIRPDDTATPSVPSRLPPPVPSPEASERPRRPERRPTAPPPPMPDEPAFVNATPTPSSQPVVRPNGRPVPPPPEAAPAPVRRRPAHTPPPARRSGTGPLLWLAILGVVAGVGGGYVYLNFVRQPRVVNGGGTQDPVPVLVHDAGRAPLPVDPEAARLEAERKAAEARRLEAEKAAAELRKSEDEKKAAEAQALAKRLEEERRAEEEKKRKDALAKAFPGKDEKRPDPDPVRPAGCPAGMKLIPAGTFKMGSAKDDPMTGFDEKPLAPTEVSAYCIDTFESPNRPGAMPQTRVTFGAAEAACRSRGKRLCTEEEWERACKGPGNARFPYGGSFDPDACNTEDGNGEARAVAATGTFGKCRSGFGVADLSGNVAEWTSSRFTGESNDRTIKGGAADRPDYDTRCAARKVGAPGNANDRLGFRCCADAP